MSGVLVVQEAFEGHRLSYVALVAAEAKGRGVPLHLMVAPSAPGSPEWLLHLSRLAGGVEVHVSDSFSLPAVRAVAQQIGVQQVVFPDGDAVLPRLYAAGTWGWVRRTEISVLVMRTRAQKVAHPVGRLARTAAKRWLRGLARVVFDIRVLELSSALTPSPGPHEVRDPVTVLASPTERGWLRETWALDVDRHWFAVLGVLTARKNIPLVTAALLRVEAPVGVLFAGRVHPDVAGELASARDRLGAARIPCRTLDRMLTDLELDEAVLVSDTVVLAHSNEGPSGILGKAAMVGTRVVCAGAVSLREDIDAFPDLGEWVELTQEALVGAFERSAQRPRAAPRGWDSGADFARRLLGWT